MNALYLTTKGDTTIYLPSTLEVEGYGCGVFELFGRTHYPNDDPLFLCSDICEESIVNNFKLPVLHRLTRDPNGLVNMKINNIIWLRIIRPTITTIRLYLCNSKGEVVSLANQELHCTLLTIPHENVN